MHQGRIAKLSLALALVGLVALTGSQAMARPKRAPPPPPPPPLPAVGMASSLLDEAGAFDGYVHDAAAISPAFTDAANVAASLRAGAAYEPGELKRGEVVYGAIVALTDPAFVAEVRQAASTPQARYDVMARIFANPDSALAFPDGRAAAALVKGTLSQEGMSLFDNGDAIRLAAYGIQHQPWSLANVADLDERAQAIKTISREARPVSQDETQKLEGMIGGEASGVQPAAAPPPIVQVADPAPPPYPPLVVHAVALAALAAIGEANDQNAPNLGWLTDDYFLAHCLDEAKLNLYECLAVARPNYEDIFCLGRHAVKETGACIVKAAGGVVPIEIATEPLRIRPAHITRHEERHRRRRRRA
ncbi:MAG: hypothetical protein ACREEW_11605 [Caulobacteraceae bacterium]